jgi:uroporphyrinogen-III synthase
VKTALVVRSGERAFPTPPEGTITLEERVSHDVEPLSIGLHELFVPAEWAIFTSRIAVRRVFEDPSVAARFRDAMAAGRIAAVGEATAGELARAGRPADLIAAGSAEALLERLAPDLANQRVVLPCGEDSGGRLPVELARRGALVERVVLYGKTARPPDRELARAAERGAFFAFCATSPSAARWLFAGAGDEGLGALRALPAVSLGPSTSAYLSRKGVARIARADPPTFEAALGRLLALAGGPAPT